MSGEANEVNWRGVQPVSGIRGVWPARNSVRVNESCEVNAAGEVITYTVPAGKILFISTAQMSTRLSADGSYWSHMSVRNVLDVHQYSIFNLVYDIKGQQFGFGTFLPALEVEAGWDVYAASGNDLLDIRANVFGWLEDA